jgi:predicted branched-subunit amino acid permease
MPRFEGHSADGVETDGRKEFLRGAKAIMPVLLGVVPVSLVAGVSAVGCGMSTLQAVGASFMMYAAAAQFVMYDMLGKGSDMVLVLFAAVVINLRFLLYSAGMAPHLQGLSRFHRLFGSYILSDQAYGLTMVDQCAHEGRTSIYFYFGAAATMWAVFQFGACLGAVLGEAIPARFELCFALPLTFSVLLVPLLDRPQFRVAALTAAVVAVLGNAWANNLGFFAGAFAGIAAGFAYQRITTGRVLDA